MNVKKIHVPPLSKAARFFDWLLTPVMYLLAGTFSESPQKTHPWNNKKLTADEVQKLAPSRMIHSGGNAAARRRWIWKLPLFHAPIFGGWRDYIVIQPFDPHAEWHVGWVGKDVAGVTQVKLYGPARVLIGPEEVSFFGLNRRGQQIPLVVVGRGEIGERGPFAKLPLL